MKSYADCLREDAKTLNSGRLTVRTTPQFGVAWLVAEVEGRTGEPYHGEIALLMNSYFIMRGLPKRFSVRAVEKRAMRYKTDVPYMYDLLQGMARMRPKPKPLEHRKPEALSSGHNQWRSNVARATNPCSISTLRVVALAPLRAIFLFQEPLQISKLSSSFCPSIGRDSGHYQFSW